MTTNDMEINTGSSEPRLSASMNADSSAQGVFLPIAILMVAVLLMLGWNLYIAKSQASIWKKQITQREQMVVQARSVQADLQKIAYDLISLSSADTDAMMIVEKYQIKQAASAVSTVSKP